MSLDAPGGSVLTEGVNPGAAAGNPPPMDGADRAAQAVMDGPPEYIPPKFWDPEKKTAKVEDLGRSYQSLERLLGREKVPVPVSDEDEEGWQRWYAATGRPDDAQGYEFERPSLPSDLPYDEDAEKNFRTWAHANGLNKKQAKNLYDAYVKTQIERHGHYAQSQKQARADAEMKMRRELGDKYEGEVNAAKAALAAYADPDYLRWLDETGAGNDPRTVRAWAKIGREMQGDRKLKGSPVQQASPEDAQKAISDFRAQHQKALFDKSHPDHERRVKEMNRLFEAAYPDVSA